MSASLYTRCLGSRSVSLGTRAEWLRHRPSKSGIAGSSPALGAIAFAAVLGMVRESGARWATSVPTRASWPSAELWHIGELCAALRALPVWEVDVQRVPVRFGLYTASMPSRPLSPSVQPCHRMPACQSTECSLWPPAPSPQLDLADLREVALIATRATHVEMTTALSLKV